MVRTCGYRSENRKLPRPLSKKRTAEPKLSQAWPSTASPRQAGKPLRTITIYHIDMKCDAKPHCGTPWQTMKNHASSGVCLASRLLSANAIVFAPDGDGQGLFLWEWAAITAVAAATVMGMRAVRTLHHPAQPTNSNTRHGPGTKLSKSLLSVPVKLQGEQVDSLTVHVGWCAAHQSSIVPTSRDANSIMCMGSHFRSQVLIF